MSREEVRQSIRAAMEDILTTSYPPKADDQQARNDQDAQEQDRQENKKSELDQGEGQMAGDTATLRTNKTDGMDRMALEDPTKLNTRDMGTAMTQEAIVMEEQIKKKEMSNLIEKFHSERFEGEIKNITAEQ